MSLADSEHRLKFMAAGREDVDVRCLGDGRPFAIEVTDPNRQLSADELNNICEEISKSGLVIVKLMVPVTKEDLTDLKKAEETKRKTYEALCIKLAHSEYETDLDPSAPVTVTDEDIRRLNTFRNTPAQHPARIVFTQRTPIRVLHRRPLLVRTRCIYELHAEKVPEHPRLLCIRLVSMAGAYIKELVHAECGRTAPALRESARAPIDLLALDVSAVLAVWPPTTRLH
ncbi:hypothetical protein evm_003163 [Chilo suppressalis]|nr:hypothetical protein evm_003163 [Chilo suppressalis]